jgi:FkbM family methyltransferase
MNLVKTMAKKAFSLIPPHNALLLKFSQSYLDRHNGENNSDPVTNGEEYLLRQVLPSMQGVVFDVGANVGNWTSFVLSVQPLLNMHLFEPSLTTYERCSQKTLPPGVHLNNFGLGERKETLQLNIVNPASGMNSLYQRRGVEGAEALTTEKIHLTTLDEYCVEHGIDHIHFMKVDVEGHELAVFRGAMRMLKDRRIDMIQFEYGGCNLDARVHLLDIWEILTQNGLQIAKIFPDGPRPISTYSQALENFRYSNYIAYLDKKFVFR